MLAPTNHPLEDIPASFTIGERWYAFYTHIHVEKLAQKSISDLGFRVFVPFEKRIVRRPNTKPRVYEAPLFPRYGFVQFDINDGRWGAIKYAKGVVDILKNMGIPCVAEKNKIDALMLAEDMGMLDRTKPPEAGMRVEATEGPFMDWIGKILKARGKDRAKVLFTFLGASREVEMPLTMLRAV